MDQDLQLITEALRAAQEGVPYDTRDGARCPLCDYKLKVRDTLPWVGNSRIRYQLCPNPECPLCEAERSIRSIQTV